MGDFWTFIAINPSTKLVFAHLSGKRITENAIKLLQEVKKRLTSLGLYITTDCVDMYTNAISSVFGKYEKNSETPIFPANFAYAQIIKDFKKGVVGKVKKKVIRPPPTHRSHPMTSCANAPHPCVAGNQELVDQHLNNSEVSQQINTSFVERVNLTFRQHARRVERKTQGYSKQTNYFRLHMSLVIAYYNFCLPHSSLTQYARDGKAIPYTPAMEAGITKKAWKFEKLLSFTLY